MITSLSVGKGGLGRFGNMAFTIASVIGIAVKSGQSFGFPRWKTWDNAIFGDPVDDIQSLLVNPLPEIPNAIWKEYGYFWDYRDIILPSGNWSIDAHLQDERYFKHCIDLVRHHFTFKDEPEQNDFVAIHYRTGDYIDDPNAYHPRQTIEYYWAAMDKVEKKSKYLFFTDKKDFTTHHNFKGNEWYDLFNYYDITTIRNQSYIEDFMQMKKCKSFITANSSFSLFAAILGNHPEKKIVAPSRWFGKSADIKFEGYPEGAIII